ncbi:MAG: pyridoxamine 5'-phosphate oxidase family protein [Mobilicoccus sp.]|nr:pyridoxamine 5'-phosphate oxidase family protein [Mobilicoccus sp.]
MHDDTEPTRAMDDDEAWAFLETRSFGRLAYAISGRPEIVPINYVAHEGKLYFRTAGGDKLFGVTINPEVAFEIDELQGEVARSVIVHGTARVLETNAEKAFVESLPLRPWIPTVKLNYVEITPEETTGREFHLGPEPEM